MNIKHPERAVARPRKILIVGNCQAETLRRILHVSLANARVQRIEVSKALEANLPFNEYDHILVQDHPRLAALIERNSGRQKLIAFPNISFSGYHADMISLRREDGGAGRHVVSNIALWSYVAGLNQEECISLYNENFIHRLNYARIFEIGRRELIRAIDRHGMPGRHWFDAWHGRAPFMMNVGHPKLFVLEDLARKLCERMGLTQRVFDLSMIVVNQGRRGDLHPPYCSDRTLDFSLTCADCTYVIQLRPMDRPTFIARQYRMFDEQIDALSLPQPRREIFDAALAAYQAERSAAEPARINPYAACPATQYWQQSVAQPESQDVAPVAAHTGIVRPDSRVATAGSCFAQHISKTLVARGMHYYVAEAPPESMPPEEVQKHHFGVFSARYGNVYTARQLLQLIQRAYKDFHPVEQAWTHRQGYLLDPFRPNVGDQFSSVEEVIEERDKHLAVVRQMFEKLDVFVFTLGLTEAWEHVADGAVYPVAPGVLSVHDDYQRYRFRNFRFEEILADMQRFLEMLSKVNAKAEIILTVSPVPLIATYEQQHVLSATTYSKSVLRAVAQTLANQHEAVHYFPSYEIITGPHAQGRYYESDLRGIRPEGVDHAMRVFVDSFVVSDDVKAPSPTVPVEQKASGDEADLLSEVRSNEDVVCDEELILR